MDNFPKPGIVAKLFRQRRPRKIDKEAIRRQLAKGRPSTRIARDPQISGGTVYNA
ncbi:MAG: hypothetical protein OXN84_17045 [Albidovulum sp.]|nr:hypothetical protein [Albidovulum sp.]